ncbi:DUF6221 family protein [Streptomyces sp. NBC_01352]|uniref:DUF6221 family protein n=1 Tax=Streptomyces sp. NBC_01352 TaxID=2903834 RepID=UPI002E365B48|nr:DUF6221 family protein [Streptomyces sp. NBC_01352]
MDEFVRWLGEQLDTDAARAEAGCGHGEGRWHHDSSHPNGYVYDENDQPVVYDESAPLPEEAEHIADWDPARVLREIDAKQRLLGKVFAYEAKIDGEWGCCHDADEIAAGQCPEIQPKDITALRLLALPYVDKPGYREEWAP